MKLKSLLFGSAAVFAAGTGAQAADLPVAEPVEYVRICDAFGAGFYYIPGTDTCLKIGGRVRIESHYVDGDDFVSPLAAAATSGVTPPGNAGIALIPGITQQGTGTNQNNIVFVNGIFPTVYTDEEREFNNWTSRARAVVRMDARTQTDFGLVRAYIEYQFTVGPADFGVDYSGTGTNLNHAYIQVTNDWGTYTAGHTSSFFDFWGSNTYGTRVGIDDNTGEQTLFGWTFGFGNGFSATISVEDPQSGGRRSNAGVGFATFQALPGVGFGSVPGFDSYEGQEAPDLVGNIRIDQGWGSAQVAGVVRHLHDETGFESGFPLAIGGLNENATPVDDRGGADAIGYAVGGGVNLNLPFFGLGFNSFAGYSEGAIKYITSDPMGRNYYGGYAGAGDFTGPSADGSLTEAFVVRAGLTGNFTPTVGFSIDGSYTEVDSAANTFANATGFGPVTIEGIDYNHQAIVGNIHWRPVAGLEFGWEAGWNHLEIENSAAQRFALSNFTSDRRRLRRLRRHVPGAARLLSRQPPRIRKSPASAGLFCVWDAGRGMARPGPPVRGDLRSGRQLQPQRSQLAAKSAIRCSVAVSRSSGGCASPATCHCSRFAWRSAIASKVATLIRSVSSPRMASTGIGRRLSKTGQRSAGSVSIAATISGKFSATSCTTRPCCFPEAGLRDVAPGLVVQFRKIRGAPRASVCRSPRPSRRSSAAKTDAT